MAHNIPSGFVPDEPSPPDYDELRFRHGLCGAFRAASHDATQFVRILEDILLVLEEARVPERQGDRWLTTAERVAMLTTSLAPARGVSLLPRVFPSRRLRRRH